MNYKEKKAILEKLSKNKILKQEDRSTLDELFEIVTENNSIDLERLKKKYVNLTPS